MMKRLSALLLVCCMLLSCVWSAQASELIDRRELYPQTLQQLKDYLDGYPVAGPDDLVNKFTLCGDIGDSYCFLQYSLCLQGIEDNDFGLVFYKIDELRMLPDFCAYLEEEGFATLDELENYALGRQAEAEGRVEDAIAYYIQAPIRDSSRRRLELRADKTEKQYQQAMTYYNAGTYADAERAASLFDELGSYKDSAAMADKARQAMDRLQYIRATDTGSGTSRSIRVEASGSWTASANVSWISLSRKSGSGNATVTVTLQKNASTVSNRTGVITFTCGNKSDTVTITQPRADSITAKLIGTGNTRTIQVTANGKWTVEESASWITLDKTSGSGDAQIKATLTKNPSATSSREYTLVFTCGSAKDTLEITQKASAVAVTGVTLDKDSGAVKVGSKLTLTATVSPSDATNKAVSWSSSNAAVATVTDGVVTGKGAGMATITVRTADGSKTDSCRVTVYGKPQITFTDYPRDAKVNTAVSFEARVNGGKAPYKYYWTMYRSGVQESSTKTQTTSSSKISWAYGAFSAAGSHQAKLTVTDALGQVVTAQTSIITVSQADSITAEASSSGNTRKITVKASGSWTAKTASTWIKLSKTSGTGDAEITATLSENTTSAERRGSVTFTCGSVTDTVYITQGKPDSITATVNGTSNRRSITVNASGSWTAKTSSTWIKLSKTSGTGNATLTATLSENTTSSSRTGTVTFTCGSKTITVYITQLSDSITVTQQGMGASRTLTVRASASWTATTSSKWIKLYQTSGMGNATVTVTMSGDEDVGTVTFTCGSKTVRVVLTRYVRIRDSMDVYVRATPSLQGRVLGTAMKGEYYPCDEASVNWYRITLEDGTKGYIYADMATLLH